MVPPHPYTDYGLCLYPLHSLCHILYEERLMRPPRRHLNRSRLRSRSVPNKVSSSHLTRHQCIRLWNPRSCPIYRADSHQCTWCCHRNFNNNHYTILCGDNCTHRNCTNCCRPDLFPSPTSYINSPASHISFLSPWIERSRRRTRRSHPGQSRSNLLDQQECSPHFRRSPLSNSPHNFSPCLSGPHWECLQWTRYDYT